MCYLQASRVIHIGPHHKFPSNAPAQTPEEACDAVSVATIHAERILGRVCRLERGGHVVAVAGGQEIVIEGVEVWNRQCLPVHSFVCCLLSLASGHHLCNGL